MRDAHTLSGLEILAMIVVSGTLSGALGMAFWAIATGQLGVAP